MSRENVKCMSPNSLYSAHCDNTGDSDVELERVRFWHRGTRPARPSGQPLTRRLAMSLSCALLKPLTCARDGVGARWSRVRWRFRAANLLPRIGFVVWPTDLRTTDKRYTIRSGDIGLSGERAQPQIDMQWPPRILRRHFSETAPTTNW